jgi:hypothetical protein
MMEPMIATNCDRMHGEVDVLFSGHTAASGICGSKKGHGISLDTMKYDTTRHAYQGQTTL